MKIHFFIFACIFNTNIVAQDCNIPTVLLDNYEKDVKHLAIIQMEKYNALELQEVEIAQQWQDTIWEGLAAIFNNSSDARNEVFDQWCIHQNSWTSQDYNRVSSTLYVNLDTSAAWYQDWENGDITTGDITLDSLFGRFGIDSVNLTFSFINTFSLFTNQNINLDALASMISAHDKVIFAERKPSAGDSDRIAYTRINSMRYYDFSVGWGDCPLGCIFRYYWKFEVDENCNTQFLGNQGSTSGIPNPINCNITTRLTEFLQEKTFQIRPNPFSSQIFVNSSENPFSGQYEIVDMLGNLVKKGKAVQGQIQNLDALHSGVYQIKLTDSEGRSILLSAIKSQ